MAEKRSSLSLFTLFLIIFLDALGVGIVLPVISFLLIGEGSQFSHLALGLRTFLLGLIVALSPLAQFFGAPFFGALSDHLGRKKVFLISLLGGFLGYILFAIGVATLNLSLLFIGRILDGFAGGNYSIALAAVSDVGSKKIRARNFSFATIAFGAGIILGPYFGAKLSDPNFVSFFGATTPFWTAALLVFINLLFVLFFFKETILKKAKSRLTVFSGFKNIARAFTMKNLRELFIVIFLFAFGNVLFIYFFQTFFIRGFGFSQSQLANTLGYYVACLALTQALITPYISKNFKPKNVLKVTLLSLALLFGLISFVHSVALALICLFFIAVSQGVSYISLIVSLTNQAREDSKGEILGINQSVEASAQIISLILAGLMASFYLYMPILLASFLSAAAWLLAIFFLRINARKQFHEV
jgi:DHA1 family tetracycline resistance protein-like MFS transporter